jgi:hypothetical protein
LIWFVGFLDLWWPPWPLESFRILLEYKSTILMCVCWQNRYHMCGLIGELLLVFYGLSICIYYHAYYTIFFSLVLLAFLMTLGILVVFVKQLNLAVCEPHL